MNCPKGSVHWPGGIKRSAVRAYRLWRDDPYHPGFHFRRVDATRPLYSLRIGIGWRALGLREGDRITWVWIGSHADYDRILSG
jgi:hypothetical protein